MFLKQLTIFRTLVIFNWRVGKLNSARKWKVESGGAFCIAAAKFFVTAIFFAKKCIFARKIMENSFYDNFLTALEERHPRKADLVSALMEVLPLEKESIYRRLRKEVYFSVEETVQIAEAWNMSLDSIARTNPTKTRPFHFNMIEYVHPRESDYKLLERYNRDLEIVASDPEGRMVEVLNALPRGLYCRSELLTRFVTMKWLYKYGMPEDIVPFSEIHIPERMRELDMEYVRLVHNIPEVHSIHDERFIEHLVDDIAYFRSIGMVTEEELLLLRDELTTLLDYMEEVTVKGHFINTGNKLLFYLSHTWLETEYALFKSKELTLSLVKILERNAISSTDTKVFDRFMNMVQATKRSSVLMSGSNILQQVEFFARQREIVMGVK